MCFPFRQRRYQTHARPSFFSGRAGNACTNLLGFLVHFVRTRGSMRLRRAAKLPIFALSRAARTCHAWLVRQTRARGKSSQREGNALFDDFWYFWSYKSTIKEKFLYVSSRAKTLVGGRKLYSAGENFDLNIKFAAKNKPRQCAADCFHYK